MEPILCDCGHMSKPDGFATGYAKNTEGKTLCYDCADKAQIEDLKTAVRFTAYLSSDGKSLTTWTGGKLADVTWSAVRAVGFGGKRTYLDATDVHGAKWYGQSPEPGMYANIKRRKA